MFSSLHISSSFKNEMFKRVIRDDGVEVYIANQPRTYICVTPFHFSHVTSTLKLIFYIYLKCSAEKVKEKKFDFNCVMIVEHCWMLFLLLSVFVVVVKFACCANSFHFSKWKSSVTPIFGIGKTFKFEYNGWLEKGTKRKRKYQNGHSTISGERGLCCFWFLFLARKGNERKRLAEKETCHMVDFC